MLLLLLIGGFGKEVVSSAKAIQEIVQRCEILLGKGRSSTCIFPSNRTFPFAGDLIDYICANLPAIHAFLESLSTIMDENHLTQADLLRTNLAAFNSGKEKKLLQASAAGIEL